MLENYQPQRGDILTKNGKRAVVHEIHNGEVLYHVVGFWMYRVPIEKFLEFVRNDQPKLERPEVRT